MEDSKAKSEKKKPGVDKRVWLGGGGGSSSKASNKSSSPAISESERALMKPHAEQKRIVANFKKQVDFFYYVCFLFNNFDGVYYFLIEDYY